MNFTATQRAFLAQVLDEDIGLPEAWDARMAAGLAVYRNAYRTRLMDVLAETYPKTQTWVGAEAFDQAAAHHLIVSPPASWTLDQAAHGFPETLAALFPNDPEIGELAWLEWTMQAAFVAQDCTPLDPGGFAHATAGFDDGAWTALTLVFVPSVISRRVSTACAAIWKALAEETSPSTDLVLREPAAVLVWREEFAPVFRCMTAQESECLDLMRGGTSFGSMCERFVERQGTGALDEVGAILGRWIRDGLVTAIG